MKNRTKTWVARWQMLFLLPLLANMAVLAVGLFAFNRVQRSFVDIV